ncbi:cytoplasmic tyrosine-protein kinase BMX [Protopterus annectens]|uniref:cytoplasmic tyrosine-protein kinase BMX n=1 Tax=Protopterus annectens TaxID=7888 RepID=UPI001CFAA59A|nr:cytoplasmic tyrosine-protein kinase BMX [Protopterus annectens]
MAQSCILQEVLLKRSQQKRKISPNNYKERLFILTKYALTYYENNKVKKGSKKGSIAIKKMKYVAPVDVEENDPVERQFPIQIVYSNGILYVYAKNEERQHAWMQTLMKEILTPLDVMLKYHCKFFTEGKFECCKQSCKTAPGCTVLELIKHLKEQLSLPPVPRRGTSSMKIVCALYDYEAVDQKDLPLTEGQKYYVINEDDPNWWKVKDISGQEGYVPSNYLSESKEDMNEPGEDPDDESVPMSKNIKDYDWYTEKLSRSQSEQLLRQKGKEGAFLVRDSSQAGKYTVSLLTFAEDKNGGIRHYHICRSSDKKYYIAEGYVFETVPELIYYHMHNSAGIITRLRHPVSAKANKIPDSISFKDGKWELKREDIVLVKELGSGQFGVVQLGKWKKKYDVAIKMIKEGCMSEDEFLEEAKVMMKIKHPRLVQLYGVCTNKYPIYIVTEFMANGCLLDYMKKCGKELQPFHLLHMCQDICEAMDFLESKQFIHRDLAARNCLVDSDLTVKVSDFGMARYVLDDQYTSSAGTKFPVKWSAPEIFHYSKFSSKSDVWAYGILMWEIFTLGKQPYDLLDNTQVVQKVTQGYRLYRPQHATDEVYQIMYSCWAEVPENRPTFHDLLQKIKPLLDD